MELHDLTPGRMYDTEHQGRVRFDEWDTYHGQTTAKVWSITYQQYAYLLPDDFLRQVNAVSVQREGLEP